MTYNEDTEHDMWGDFDNFEKTGSPDVFEAPDLDNYIENLNDLDYSTLRILNIKYYSKMCCIVC